MDREFILTEIKRTANENGGNALGQVRFLAATGLRESDWKGRFWSRWGDALQEAGFVGNQWNPPLDETFLLETYVAIVRRLGRLPTKDDINVEARRNGSPTATTYRRRFGNQASLIHKLRDYCSSTPDFADILTLAPDTPPRSRERPAARDSAPVTGYVYLLRSGRYWKIGYSISTGRREYEIGLQMPEKPSLVHSISTDDPVGIEAYWHKRFAAQRRNGEWFELSAADVAAFRRRKFM